ncbi:hypothetical protein C8Q73DRAFT_785061 [Cubamyces lactineus]|nr:hypothetical protein C8Q73DRAFT_785061 [Cubamyces lactineus]
MSAPLDGVPIRSLLTVASPLLDLRKMRTFMIHSIRVPFMIEDADLEALSVAWPSLSELHIKGMSIPDRSSASITGMRGLFSLATNCPNLTAFSIGRIVFRSEDVAVLPIVPMNHPLKVLVVVHGVPSDVYHLIRDKLFPNINLQLHRSEDEEGLYYA